MPEDFTLAPPKKNLIQKLAEVMAHIDRVPKTGYNEFHKYDYATEADITTAARKKMADLGLLMVPTVEELLWREVGEKKTPSCLMKVLFTIYDGDSPESLRFSVYGEGQDTGDKATYKAMTGSVKYALLKLFLIPTGDDPERDDGEKPSEKPGVAKRNKPRGHDEKRCPTCHATAIIEGKAEYGGGWICFKKKGGCGARFQSWPPVPPPQVVAERAPLLAEQIEQIEQIDVMMGRITALGDKLALKAPARAALWTQFCGEGATPKNVDIAALQDLYKELAERWAAKQVPAVS